MATTRERQGLPEGSDPPGWPGFQHYRLWKKAVSRWHQSTDVKYWRRSEKILKSTDWELQARFEHISDQDLQGPNYLEHLFQVLDVLAGEKEFSEMRRSVRAALYEGFMLEEQAGLSKQALQSLRVLTAGNSEYEAVKQALRVIDIEEESLCRSGKGSSFWQGDETAASEKPDWQDGEEADEESDVLDTDQVGALLRH
eukprot:s1981_g6.t1